MAPSTAATPRGPTWQGRVVVLAAALWWGSVTTTGFMVVPMLFANLPSPAAAGAMAAKLFSAQTWLAVGCGALLLFASRANDGDAQMGWARGAVLFVIAGLLLALLSEFGVAPRIVARVDLKLWHAVGSGMYLLQWVCAGVVLWKVTGSESPSSRP